MITILQRYGRTDGRVKLAVGEMPKNHCKLLVVKISKLLFIFKLLDFCTYIQLQASFI